MKSKTNKVEFGLNNVHYSVITYDELNNKSEYSKPKKLNGAISLNMEVEGESTTVYADNAIYLLYRS